MDEIKIKVFALENAIKFKGRANPGAVVGKVISENPELKKDMKNIVPIINKIVSEINNMGFDDQKELLFKLNPNFEKEQIAKKKENKEKRSDIPELKNAVMGKVVTRIAPEPSKYAHLGHAASFLINYMYKKKYDGKCIIRFDDTNPEKETQEFVDAMTNDVIDYLGIKADKTVFASDYNEELILMAEQLISEGKAYTCTCQKEMSLNRREMKSCIHREKSVELVKKEWDEMKLGENKGMVLRLKIDMQHKNAVMRDPVIFRIITTTHYRQKDTFKVWPMYDFECAILEGKLGITHVNRSNEFESRIELQDYIRGLFDLQNPTIRQYARFNVTGAITKGREIKEMIDSGEYIGWDDPRLLTLRALKRRGILPESFYELAKVLGMSKTNSNLDFSVIASINRKLLDETSKRFFCVIDPVEIRIKNVPSRELNLKMHPHLNIGTRKLKVGTDYYIENKDKKELETGKVMRLIDNCTFKGDEFISIEHTDKSASMIHYVPIDENEIVSIEIRMPDNSIVEGLAEKSVECLKVGEIVQFQRFGFCRLDEIRDDGTRSFWYTHK